MPYLLDAQNAPRSTRTLAELRDRVRRDLALKDGSWLTDDDLTDWLNEAQDELARELRWFRTSEVTGTTAGTKEYALPLPPGARSFQIEEITYENEQLFPVLYEDLILLDWHFRQAGDARPLFFYVRGNTAFGLHPTPDVTATSNLTAYYVALPPRVTAPDERLYIPHGMDRGAIIYAKLLASEKDMYGEGLRRLDSYQVQWQEFLRSAKRQVNLVTERRAAVLGEDRFVGPARPRVPYHTEIT